MGAFKAAIEAGYPFELDVHMNADGELVIIHDDNLKRMTGINRAVKDTTDDELQSLRLWNYAGKHGKKKKTTISEFGIPKLREVLEMTAGRVPILVELKFDNDVGEPEDKLLAMLEEYPGDYVLESFHPFSVRYLKKAAPQYVTGLLSYQFPRKTGLSRVTRKILRECWMEPLIKPDFIAYDIQWIPKKNLNRKRNKGIPLIAWTIRDELDRAWAMRYCDGYIFENIRP